MLSKANDNYEEAVKTIIICHLNGSTVLMLVAHMTDSVTRTPQKVL
jgi:hypothetical protein